MDKNELVATKCMFTITSAGESLGLGKAGKYPTVVMMSQKEADRMNKGARA